MRIKYIISCVAGLIGFNAVAQQKGLPLDPAVRTGKLSNGFTYYIRHNEEPKHRVLMYLVNKAGSVLEDDDQQGLAHFMEHMNFNGTRHFPHNDLIDYLQKEGVRFGADINAYTSFDETVYQLPLPSDKPTILNTGIEIMHDWAQSATLDPIEIDKERGVVLEEKRLGKGASERMQRQYWPMLLENSRYAVRIPIGIDTVLDNFKRPAIYRFYHDWYRPDLQALIIVGDVNADSLVKVIKTKFADLKNPTHERPRTKYRVPLSRKSHFMAVTDKEMTVTAADVIFKHAQEPLRTATDYRLHLIRELVNQMLSERYAELSKISNPPFVQGSAGIGGFTGGLDIYDASVVAKPGQLELGVKALWRETERVKRFGFTVTEFDRAKAEYLSKMQDEFKEMDKTNSASLIGEYQDYFLKGTAAPGIRAEYELILKDLPGISLIEANKLIQSYTRGADRDILVLAPDKDKNNLPSKEKINQWMEEVNHEPLKPYVDQVSNLPLLAKQLQAGTITSVTHDPGLNLTTWILNNGIKVVIKPTDFKNDEILFAAFAPGGTSLASDADYQSAASAASIVNASGIGNYNSTELDKFLSGKQVQVSPFVNERFEGLSGNSTVSDLETALQMADAYLTEPRKDTAIFKGLIDQTKTELTNRANNPSAVFSDTVSAVLSGYNLRKTGPSFEKIRQIKLDKAYSFYREHFSKVSNFTFVFAGNIDTLTFKPLVMKYLASLPVGGQADTAKDLGIHIPYGKINKTVYKGSEPKATVLLIYSGLFDYNQENRVSLDALRECVQIRLLQRLREEESGVYSPSVGVNSSKYPQGRYSFVVQFGCAPQNVKKLIASTNDEIGKLRANGPLQANLDKWRAEDKSIRETQLKTNNYWLAYLNTRLQNQEEFNQVELYNGIRDSITVQLLKKAAQKYLSGENYIELVLLPEQGIENK